MQQKSLSKNKSVKTKKDRNAKQWMTRGLAGLLGLIMILSLITPLFT